jgi:hypothetical protein
MSEYQPSQDPSAARSTGVPPVPPGNTYTQNNYYTNAPYTTNSQGHNFGGQSAQISGYQPSYTRPYQQGQPEYFSSGTATGTQAQYQSRADSNYASPQSYSPTALQAWDSEAYSPPPRQAAYTSYNSEPQNTMGFLEEPQAYNAEPGSSTDGEWIYVSICFVLFITRLKQASN